jgi:pyruvoyl-dependent arginine decarboxylase (PvlArgDC)
VSRTKSVGAGDAGARAKLEEILRDPAGYYAEARRRAQEWARREVAERLASVHLHRR